MLQERIEGKWLASFRRAFALNGIGRDTSVIIIAETQSRPVLVHLAELACFDLGAEFSIITVPTPPLDAPVPVKSTGACKALRGMRPVVGALKAVDVIVDVTVEGLIHAPEWPEIEEAGARLFTVCNEHPEILERTEPRAELAAKVEVGIAALKQAKTMRVTSEAGTDLTIDLRGAACGGTPGFTTRPGGVAHWPGGLCLCFPGKNTINGRVVMDVGDQNLTFKTFLQNRVVLEVRNDYVTDIVGDNLDAELTRDYLASWNDPEAYGFSHVGWGVNPGARWVSMALFDKRDMQATEFRAFAGSFLFSTGANQYAGRFTEGHFDFPMRNCTVTLDDEVVVRKGILQGRFA